MKREPHRCRRAAAAARQQARQKTQLEEQDAHTARSERKGPVVDAGPWDLATRLKPLEPELALQVLGRGPARATIEQLVQAREEVHEREQQAREVSGERRAGRGSCVAPAVPCRPGV